MKRKHNQKRASFKTKHRKRRTKKPIKLKYEEPDDLKRAPHSFVIHKGNVGRYILDLEKDFRKVMDPFTASSLQVQRRNTVKDFVAVSSILKVSHLIIFTNSQIGPYVRIARVPHGPTLMFRIHNYSLNRDVLSSLKKQMTNKKLFTNAPLVILNNFSGDGSHIKLMASVFQNMFPSINVTKAKLSDIRRCCMFNYNPETKLIDFRHYAIKAIPIGISRGVKKIVQSKIPNLAKYEDISEFLTKPSMLSESEMEDDPNSHVEVPQKLPSRGNLVSQQSSIRLSEIGPRLTLQLIKVEEGLLNGEVMFHELVHKTEEQKRRIRKKLAEKRRLKEERRQNQEDNVQKKQEMKELHKQKSLEGMRKKRLDDVGEELQEDDDVEYFREEVGDDPDEGVFHAADSSTKRTKKAFGWQKRSETDETNKSKPFRKKPSHNEEDSRFRKFNKGGRSGRRFEEDTEGNRKRGKYKSGKGRWNDEGKEDGKRGGRKFSQQKFGEGRMKHGGRKSKLVTKIRDKFRAKSKGGKSKMRRRKN